MLTIVTSRGIINKHFARGGREGKPSRERKGPWKLNNDESKEPDKIQKSFICTRIWKDTKAVIANESVRESEEFLGLD